MKSQYDNLKCPFVAIPRYDDVGVFDTPIIGRECVDELEPHKKYIFDRKTRKWAYCSMFDGWVKLSMLNVIGEFK